jgi:hypothetical protein
VTLPLYLPYPPSFHARRSFHTTYPPSYAKVLEGSSYNPQKSTADLSPGSGTMDERFRSSYAPVSVLHKIHKGQAGFDAFFTMGVLNRLIPHGHGADEWKKLVGACWFKTLLASCRKVNGHHELYFAAPHCLPCSRFAPRPSPLHCPELPASPQLA